MTDLQGNNNKYYVLEYHRPLSKSNVFRLYSHYGRTDDLLKNPKSGQRECRYYNSDNDAQNSFSTIIIEKTGKGF
jgi:predicted DNA-binding WGR domain protein